VTPEPVWLSEPTLLVLHDVSISKFGGSFGIRDSGLLDSALNRPQQVFHYNPNASWWDLAAAYAFGLAKNHAFIDGNKRVAFLAATVFLESNGFKLASSPSDATDIMVGVAAGSVSEAELARWLEKRSEKKANT
jgi:death on curing protein